MPKKRIKSKKKFNYDYLEPYDSLYCALTWIDIDGVNIDWNDRELIKKLWNLHGEKIMEIWRQDPANAGKRPKIWWYVNSEKDIKVLRYEKYKNVRGEIEAREIDGHLTSEYSIYESESSYLKRKGLLESWELEVLSSFDYGREELSLPY